MPSVTIIENRYVYGWPDEPDKPAGSAYQLSLGRALMRAYSTDAHFGQYATPNGRRLKKDALAQGIAVEMTCVVFDVDDPEMHGTSSPAREEWRAEIRAKMAGLYEAHPGTFFYETKGGARFLYRLSTPVTLQTPEDDRRWSQQYNVAIAYFARRFGIDADPSCADWTRLFRLPRATRQHGQPENWLIVGDPNQVGTLRISAEHEDVQRARKASRAFDAARSLNFTPCHGDGQGLLFHLLRAQGALVRPHGANAYVVRCPNEQQHTGGRTGDGSTLLYLPAMGHEIGALNCYHAHCQGLRVRDWLGLFSQVELDLARQAAGILRSA